MVRLLTPHPMSLTALLENARVFFAVTGYTIAEVAGRVK